MRSGLLDGDLQRRDGTLRQRFLRRNRVQELELHEQYAGGVVDFVSDPGSQPAHGGHLLGLQELGLGAFELSRAQLHHLFQILGVGCSRELEIGLCLAQVRDIDDDGDRAFEAGVGRRQW